MDIKPNVVRWFEIQVLNLNRATRFNQAVFDFELSRHQVGPLDMAGFPRKAPRAPLLARV
jgi:predicted enzyme related to lactoylglutathione lyase